jgi:hypothetical protein
MFSLALTFGMEDDVRGGVARMVGLVEEIAAHHGIDNSVQMSLGISDGEHLYAFRYSTAGASRTLFYSAHAEAAQELAPQAPRFHPDARAIVSEPLTDLVEQWVPVPEASFITVHGSDIERQSFEPERHSAA